MEKAFKFSQNYNVNGHNSNMLGKSSSSASDIPLPPPPSHILALGNQSDPSICSESPYLMPPPPPVLPLSDSKFTDTTDTISESIVPPPMPIINPPPRQPVGGILSINASKSPRNPNPMPKSSPPVAVPPRISSFVTASKTTRSSESNPNIVSILKPKSLPPLQLNNARSISNTNACSGSIHSAGSDASASFSNGSSGGKDYSYCNICGQMHESSSNHIYSYSKQVLSELICQLCNNPLVDPLQTKCSHTFCAACLKSRLATNATCPEDHQIINYLECSPAANIVKSLLDKLLVYCPNELCTEKLPRSDLEGHLSNWCHGNSHHSHVNNSSNTNSNHNTNSNNSNSGFIKTTSSSNSATINCNSSNISTNKWDCNFEKSPHTTSTTVTVSSTNSVPLQNDLSNAPSSTINLSNCDDSNPGCSSVSAGGSAGNCQHTISSSSSSDVANNNNSNPHGRPINSNNNRTTVRFDAMPQFRRKNQSCNDEPDVCPGSLSVIVIERSNNIDLGISFVGGYDTPLQCIIIQDIYLDGAIAKDGRLRPGDQIMMINDIDLNQASHLQARNAFLQIQYQQRQHQTPTNPSIRLTVFRERIDDSCNEKEEILQFCLSKRTDKKLGIKLVGQKNKPGLFVFDLVKGSEADLDGRLRKNDRILNINGVDLKFETQDTAANVINNAEGEVKISVSRIIRLQTPDLIQTGGSDSLLENYKPLPSLNCFSAPPPDINRSSERIWQPLEKSVTIEKSIGESLGMSVAGGVNSQRGDTPVYITNLKPNSVVARTRAVTKGDILLQVNDTELLGLSHEKAVEALKAAGKKYRHVTMRLLPGPETSSSSSSASIDSSSSSSSCDNNFLPSWTYWLQLPRYCEISRIIRLKKESAQASLGFSIVGGIDNTQPQSSPIRFVVNQNGSRFTSTTPNSLKHPIVVKSIVIGSIAHRNGRLKCGDLLLKVNKFSLINVSHEYAVNLFKNIQDEVILHVVSWPGSIV